MTYYIGAGGTLTSIQDQIRAIVPTHPAWSLVESTTFGSSLPADVYKCDHAVSGMFADFYAVVIRNNTFSSLYFGIAEGYNPSTHKPQRPAMHATATLQTLQADGGVIPATTEVDWYNGSYNPGGGSISAAGVFSALQASGAYAIVVAKDGFAVTSGSASLGGTAYVGAYDSALSASDDPLPIFVGTSDPGGASTCHATRHPRRGGLGTGFACNLNGTASNEPASSGSLQASRLVEANSALMFAPASPPNGDGYDSYQADFTASRVALLNSYVSGSSTVGRYVNGWRRGWAKYLRATAAGGYSLLDGLTIDGVAYLCADTRSPSLWIERDPA
ncbi:MAG TPA: hypothetical protein VFM01_05055 [Nakamurella sp.]|nr:hypothetical protein [Nakamurella sp.]